MRSWLNGSIVATALVAAVVGAVISFSVTRSAGQAVRPAEVGVPTLVVLPSRDRIVPPRSAEALAGALPNPTMLRPPFGHIGMMASAQAPDAVWQPIAEWLRARLLKRT